MLSADLEGTAADQLGVRRSVVEAIALKTLFYLGEASVQELADRMLIAPYIVEGHLPAHAEGSCSCRRSASRTAATA